MISLICCYNNLQQFNDIQDSLEKQTEKYELICKKYKQNFMRRIFIWAAKKKYVALCELLLVFQARR